MARPRGHRLSAAAFDDSIRHAGLTLTDTAERAGVARSTLSAWLGGHYRASVPMARKLADTLGVHPETLFPTLHPAFTEVDQ